MNFDEDLVNIHKDVSDFLSKNKDKYEIITDLQNNLYKLNEDLYSDTIQIINDNKELFFKDHTSAVFFFCIIIRSSRFNFKNFEINLNILINFSAEIKKCRTTDYELIGISASYYNSLNYLFSKNFFSIESIVEHSFGDTFIFINFLPEISQYDPEYATLQKQKIFNNIKVSKLSDLFVRDPYININFLREYLEKVEKDPKEHVLNRTLNYHHSKLHKSIREDDIDTFQSLLYKNNIDINHRIENSYYERSKTIDDDMSLIQIASIYGSIKVFKFLWQKENIFIDQNLLCYAYCGYNFEIIHICESKCSLNSVYLQPIALHQDNLLDYFIENFSSELFETNSEIEEALQNFSEDEDNVYQSCLNWYSIEMAFYSVNFPVILSCLEKVAFIAKNVKNIETFDKNVSMSYIIFVDFDLFKFIYSQRHSNVNKLKCNSYIQIMMDCINENRNDIFKFVYDDLNGMLQPLRFLGNCLQYNHDMANYILSLKTNKYPKNIPIDYLLSAIEFYNEEIVVKMIKTFNFFNNINNIFTFSSHVVGSISLKMAISLMKKLSSFLPNNVIILLINALKKYDIRYESYINDFS
ncbi:hypothetical protein M9Y10_008806 [Tritrichomonas musculus]|uniref:DUF3447 domain-containing protein n=1 Tax=Tritrichomonas musculus TaxID=1915356 RepID=A0ABR2IZC6_9EUKA